ncbi:hypothetical protein BGW80DRAFT_1355667, partial [Lactifluus volemus]
YAASSTTLSFASRSSERRFDGCQFLHFSLSLSCVRYVPPSTSFSHMYLDNTFIRCAPTFLRLLLFVTVCAIHVISLLSIPNILWMPVHATWFYVSQGMINELKALAFMPALVMNIFLLV